MGGFMKMGIKNSMKIAKIEKHSSNTRTKYFLYFTILITPPHEMAVGPWFPIWRFIY